MALEDVSLLIVDAVQIVKQPAVVASTGYIDMPVDEPWKHQLEFACAAQALTFSAVLSSLLESHIKLSDSARAMRVVVLLHVRGECDVSVVRV